MFKMILILALVLLIAGLSEQQAVVTTVANPTTVAAATTVVPIVVNYGQMTISVSPSNWVNYSSTAVVTFSFNPPCPNISLWRTEQYSREACVIGPACTYAHSAFAMTTVTIDSSGASIKISNVTTLVNGYYYATCPSNQLSYRAAPTSGTYNLALGVNPRVIKVSVRQGYYIYTYYNLTRSTNAFGGPDQFVYNLGSISLSSYDYCYLSFGVGRGLDPNSTSSSTSLWSTSVGMTNFTFSVPDFDQPSSNYSFIKKSLYDSSSLMTEVTPYGQWYSYVIYKDDLAKANTCSVEGRAVATLRGAPVQDIVNFRISLTYPLTVGSITVDRSQSCSCVFTCNVNACPSQTPGRFEWAFYDNSSYSFSSYNIAYMQGNVLSRPDQYVLSESECQDKFRTARRLPYNYNIRCRVYSGSSYASWSSSSDDLAVPLYSLLRPCSGGEFQCVASKQCIPTFKQCNNRTDCSDGSDELNCTKGACNLGEFQCPTSKECISSSKMCDSVSDCADGSDENNCTAIRSPCAATYFRCANGRCVRGRYVCDGDQDCRDGSDESRCGTYGSGSSCSRTQFACSNGNCLDRYLVCNSIDNCGDNSDEAICGTFYSPSCGVDYWQCANSRCILSSDLCDQENDCGDYSDEANCGAYSSMYGSSSFTTVGYTTLYPGSPSSCSSAYFSCANGRCVSLSDQCDGGNDCGDYSDERNCTTCPNGRFHCNNNKCISPTYVCDGDSDCGDGSDEAPAICSQCSSAMKMWRCKINTNKCIYITRVCDGTSSCGAGDNSDESPEACAAALGDLVAAPMVCQPGFFKCTSSSLCVPQTSLCNGVIDCCPDQTYSSLSSSSYLSSLSYSSTYALLDNATHIGSCEKTDEIGCTKNTQCSVNNGGCAGTCTSITVPSEPSACGGMTPAGQAAYCSCSTGFYRPLSNFSACIDIDECRAPLANNCSQTCNNTIGSFSCGCASGFIDKGVAAGKNATGMCIVVPDASANITADPQILFVYDDTIRLFQKPKATVLALTTLDKTFTALDVDIRDGTIIYAEFGESSLKRTTFPVNGQPPVSLSIGTNMLLSTVFDLSVDFIGNNLYIADILGTSQSRIIVSLVDGRYQKVLLRSSLKITSLATNPLLGTLYYATYTSSGGLFSTYSSSQIIMTSMNGDTNNNAVIYSARNQGAIQTIAVDYLAGGRLYFFDGLSIVLSNYDGSGNSTFKIRLYAPLPRAFDVFGSQLFGFFSTSYYADASTSEMMYEVDKFSRPIYTNITWSMLNVGVVRVYHPLKAGRRSSWPSPCAKLKCSHLCLLGFNGTASCACPDSTDQQVCRASAIPEPDHPATCLKSCVQGQGICAKDQDREAYVCLCNKFFSGRFCNETNLPTTTTPIPTTSTSPTTPATAPAVTAEAIKTADSNKSPGSVGENMSGVLIAIIVIAVIVLVVLIAVIAFGVLFWRRKMMAARSQFTMQQMHNGPEVIESRTASTS